MEATAAAGKEKNTNQSKTTRLGHWAAKAKEGDSAGREYCNCQEENNQKCGKKLERQGWEEAIG